MVAAVFAGVHTASAKTNNEGMQLIPATIKNNSGVDAQVYVAIIGQSGTQAAGTLDFYSATNSNGTVTNYTKNSQSNIGYVLKLGANNKTTIMVPQLQSARMYISLFSALNVTIAKTTYKYPNPKTGPNTGTYYAIGGPAGWTPTDPNYSTPFDWVEYDWAPGSGDQTMFINTTQVDMYGLPIKMTFTYVNSKGKSKNTTVGAVPDTWNDVFTAFAAAGSPWTDLVVAPHGHSLEYLRIVAPQHGINTAPFNFPSNQLDSYIGSVFNYYKTNELTIEVNGTTYVGKTGTVNNKTAIIFNDNTSDAIFQPTTLQVYMNTIPSTAPGAVTDLFAASLLRSTLLKDSTPSDCNTKTYYKYPPVDAYAKIFHKYQIANLAYAMAYDDNCNQSTTISGTPQKLLLMLQPMDVD